MTTNQLRPTARLAIALVLVAVAGLVLAPSAVAAPSAPGYYAGVSAGGAGGSGCVSVNSFDQCYTTPVRTNAAYYATAGAVVRPQGCTTHVCPPAEAWYYGYATPDGRTYIVIGPGPTPPPGCTYTCPGELVRWILDQLP